MNRVRKIADLSLLRLAFMTRLYLGTKAYTLLLSVLVGIMAGLAAVLLYKVTALFAELAKWLSGYCGYWFIPALPALGILLTVILIRTFCKGTYDKSLSGVISSTFHGHSNVPKYHCFSHIFTSGITVGMGASAGLEAPIALTGSAIGSNTARLLHTNVETRTLLLACGGAAGISAIFNSPVAGALFACEILLPSFSIPALIPLLMASASAAVVADLIVGQHPFIEISTSWSSMNIPFYIVLGIISGLISTYTIKVSVTLSKKLERFKNPAIRFLAGSAFLYAMFLFLPGLRAQGYPFIAALIRHQDSLILADSPLANVLGTPWAFLGVCILLIFLKVLTTNATLEAGGDGGIFAPSMFIGAFTGFSIARFFNLLAPYFDVSYQLSELNFLCVGMGGVLAGVMHAPMTGMFLIAEMTGGYKLFIPLMIVVSLATFISKRFAKYNVYKAAIEIRGGSAEPNQTAVIMEKATLRDLIETDFVPVKATDSLRFLLKVIMNSKRNIYPVLDDDHAIIGIVTLDHVRSYLLDSELYDVVVVYDIMQPAGPVLDVNESLASATHLFEDMHLWSCPVTAQGKYLGFVSKAGVFDRYREMLRNKPELF